MTTRALCVVGLAVVVSTVAAQVPEAWQYWRYEAAIAVDTSDADGGLVRAEVPVHVTARSLPGWADFRIVDAQGAERPFILHANRGGRTLDRRSVVPLEPAVVDGNVRQIIVDAGVNGARHNSMRLHIETKSNLLARVEVAVSSDLVDWRVVREAAPIYVLRADGMGENTDVTYPDSVSRYVRVRVSDGGEAFSIRSAEIGLEQSTVAEHVSADVALGEPTQSSGRTVWASSGNSSHVPVSRVAFVSAEAPFFRSVSVEATDDGRRWQVVATGEVLRVFDALGSREWLSIDVPERYARRWRVTVDNRNDAAVADLRPTLMTTPRYVVFRADSGESYTLLYGHPRAEAPRYDLARLTPSTAIDAAPLVAIGAETENAAWVDPAPWTERYDALLWVVLLLAVIVIGVVAIRTLRSAGRSAM